MQDIRRGAVGQAPVSRAGLSRFGGPRPWPYSTALLTAYAGAAAVTAVAVAAGADRYPAAGLAGYALLAALVCLRARPLAGPAVAVIGWLFDDGFLIGRHADLAWPGAAGGWRLALLLAAAAAGALAGAALRRRQAAREVGARVTQTVAAWGDVRAWREGRHTDS